MKPSTETKARAKAARAALKAARKALRRKVTREQVVAAYRHPAPLVVARDATPAEREALPADARAVALKAEAKGYHDTRIMVGQGTTPPTWRVNAPDSKPNPGPPVHKRDYHGDLVHSVGVYGRGHSGAFRAVWIDGKIDSVLVRPPFGTWQASNITRLKAELTLGVTLTPTARKAKP